MSSATSNVKHSVSRAADSKPLEMMARAGFIGYGVIHLLFAWLALQLAFGGGGGQDSDQSGALNTLAQGSGGKFLVAAVGVGMVAMAIWQAFEAVVGESGLSNKRAIAERVLNVARAILYGYLAFTAYKVYTGANASMGDSQQSTTSTLMDSTGGRWLVGFAGLVVIGVGVGMAIYGFKEKFTKHLNMQQMPATVRKNTVRLGKAGYMAKGTAYGIAGILLTMAAVTYDPDKARGLDGALKTLASESYGVFLLVLIALGIAAFGVYCFAQAKYRKV